ncbi:hypothetical protein ACN47E_007661 [Coniothyrium glycines]
MTPPRTTAVAERARRAKKRNTKRDTVQKVIKRPARGYHKFRNGLLNVTPKGGEKELVKANRSSPLLRLPAEIRNKIWNYTLDDIFYRIAWTSHGDEPMAHRSVADGPHGLSLLRACRQIYAEAAAIPFTSITFAFDDVTAMKAYLKTLGLTHRKRIAKLQVDSVVTLPSMPLEMEPIYLSRVLRLFLQQLPALKHFQMVTYPCNEKVATVDNIEQRIARVMERHMEDSNVNFTIERSTISWSSYLAKFTHPTLQAAVE